MVLGGAPRDDQPLRDLGVGQPLVTRPRPPPRARSTRSDAAPTWRAGRGPALRAQQGPGPGRRRVGAQSVEHPCGVGHALLVPPRASANACSNGQPSCPELGGVGPLAGALGGERGGQRSRRAPRPPQEATWPPPPGSTGSRRPPRCATPRGRPPRGLVVTPDPRGLALSRCGRPDPLQLGHPGRQLLGAGQLLLGQGAARPGVHVREHQHRLDRVGRREVAAREHRLGSPARHRPGLRGRGGGGPGSPRGRGSTSRGRGRRSTRGPRRGSAAPRRAGAAPRRSSRGCSRRGRRARAGRRRGYR